MRIIGVTLITFTHIRHNFTEGPFFFILETVPRYGTFILCIVSGYLFAQKPNTENLLRKKITSLLIPFLIANIVVLIPVLILNYFGYNFLNRLTFDSTIITEGLFSLHSPPINPPTYFIRDLFMIFCLISLYKRNYYSLIFLIPMLIFGKLFLRWDIACLFVVGFIVKTYSLEVKYKSLLNFLTIAGLATCFLFKLHDYYGYFIGFLFFLNVINLKFKFIKTGAYTYLLHLYHSPIIVFLFPFIHAIYPNPYFETFAQIILYLLITLGAFLLIKKYHIQFIIGNRL